jgi:hypothetical protein
MKITSVIVDISPELAQKLQECGRLDKSCGTAFIMLRDYGHGETDLKIYAEVAAAWCQNWFGADAMLAYQETDWLQEPEDPDCCEDPVIKEFVNAVLGIYRLCQTV